VDPLRDLLVTAIIVGSLPACFLRPWIGILVWTWFGTMNPHRLTWGFAHDYPFAELIAAATLAGIPFAKDRQPLPRTRETYILLALWAWFAVTTFFADSPDEARGQLIKVSKIFLFTFIGLLFFQDRRRLRYLVLVLALSIGFFGVKGGLWALMIGGTERVEGPEGSFIGGNTGLALGLDMALPLFVFLARDESNPWLRRGLWLCALCAIPAVVFTYSRGGLLGLAAVLAVIAVKSRRKLAMGIVFIIALVGILTIAPQKWFDRTDTIVNYEGEGSAMGRILAWGVALRYALDHPIVGGGFFATAREEVYIKYARESAAHVPHSVWFSMLSEHGFPGLVLFLSLLVSCFVTLRRMRRSHDGSPPAPWIVTSSHMLEGSLVGYVVAGSFLNAAYMNVFYWLVAFVIMLGVLAARESTAMVTAVTPPLATAPVTAKPFGALHVRYRWLR
jgi:probable O-glycosylation ligase (exosortase A-associated)